MNYLWIILIIALIFGCYVLYKRGKFREEDTYITPVKKCPYDQDDCPDFELTIDKTQEICRKCDRYKKWKTSN